MYALIAPRVIAALGKHDVPEGCHASSTAPDSIKTHHERHDCQAFLLFSAVRVEVRMELRGVMAAVETGVFAPSRRDQSHSPPPARTFLNWRFPPVSMVDVLGHVVRQRVRMGAVLDVEEGARMGCATRLCATAKTTVGIRRS